MNEVFAFYLIKAFLIIGSLVCVFAGIGFVLFFAFGVFDYLHQKGLILKDLIDYLMNRNRFKEWKRCQKK